jgi:transposase
VETLQNILLKKEGKSMISVGIDVSKGKSTVCIMKPGGELLVEPYEMLHNIECICSLVHLIHTYDEEVRVVLEDTGHYHFPIITLLVEKHVFVTCINALRMKNFCSQSIRIAKTDRIDSIKIARYGITYWDELTPVLPRDDAYSELRIFARQYYQYVGLLTKAKINLSNLIDQVMPEINCLLHNINDNHKLTNFLYRYWHFGNILKMGERRFVSDYCTWAKKQGYHLNERKAKQIFALSQNGIPVIPCAESTKILVQETVRIIHEIERSRNTILSHIEKIAKTLPEFSVLISMHGIGATLAARFIAEIGDIRRFHSKNAIIAYAGIDAPPYQSGSFTATNRSISKRGNKYLRRTGFEIMQSFMRKKPIEDCAVYNFMLKKHAEGKALKCCKIAGLNKFLKIYYARVNEVYHKIQEQLVFGSNL